MSGFLSDLVRDSKLETTALAQKGVTCHIVSHRTAGPSPERAEEKWQRRDERLGKGALGAVWLEECTAGRKKATCARSRRSSSATWTKNH